jgi:perosamine synthetase
MSNERIPVAGPSITEREIAYVTDAAKTAWYGTANIYIDKFERAFAEYCGVDYAMALPSCTSAIHLALMALGVGPGDEVIVPELTWIASAAPIHYVGATPIFVDVDPATWCMSVDSFRERITPRTKAVIPVDLYGGMPDLEKLRAVAQEHKIAFIEDAAEAAGAKFHGHAAGSFGDVGVFSFHGSKTLTTGEGGMLITRNKPLLDRIHILRDHGRRPGDVAFFNAEIGHKYKMSALQAALGLAQLERIEELIAMKQTAFGWYRQRLSDIEGVTLNAEPEGTRNAYWMNTIVWDERYKIDKTQFGAALAEQGIDTRPFFHPLSGIPAYKDASDTLRARETNKNAYRIGTHGLNLPSSLSLTETQVDRVCKSVLAIILRKF